MAQVSYPGVYVQEKSSGVKTITGVSTSITAFFGRSLKGPLNNPVRCLSYADFRRNFGGGHQNSELGVSLKQFFDNGGTDCYVVRVAHGATRAGLTLRNYAGASVLTASAKMEGIWGNGLRLEIDYNTPNPGETFNVKVLQEEGGAIVASELFINLSMDPASSRYAPTFVTQSSELISLTLAAGLDLNAGSFDGFSEARRPLGTAAAAVQTSLANRLAAAPAQTSFEISVDGSAYQLVNLAGWTVPAALNDIQTQLAQRINDQLAALVPAPRVAVTIAPSVDAGGQHFLRITADTNPASNTNRTSVRIRRAPGNDLAAALMMGADNGGVELARRSNFRPAPTGVTLRYEASTNALTRLNQITGTVQPGLTSIIIDGVTTNFTGDFDLTTSGAGDGWFEDDSGVSSPNGNNDGVREKLRLIAAAINANASSRHRAEVQGYQLAILPKDGSFNTVPLSVAFTGGAAAVINPLLVRNVRQYALGNDQTTIVVPAFMTFNVATQTGSDGTAPEFADYVGDQAAQTGFHALDPVDLFNLMVIPTDSEVLAATREALWGPASVYCRSRRAFLLIDPPDAWTNNGKAAIVQNSTNVNNLRATVIKDHSAVFYPRIKVNDGGLVRTIGPSGSIAGLMSRIDASRGVWKAPAGTEADLRALGGLEVKLTDMENGVLNKLGANCLRSFPSGFVNWGARTLDGSDDLGSEWKYIPIRRLALFLQESLYRGTQWVVFEPNDEPLWAKIRLNIGAFMNGLFRQGAFQGSTPDQAFYVKCDADTTTQADRNLGIVNIEIGFAPLKPAEFVVITIQQIAGDLK
jgi:uncharacterized protein